MWPEIPENLSSLSAAQLRTLAREIRTAAQAVLAASPTADDVATVNQFLARRGEILAEAERKEEVARLEAALADDTSDAEPTPEPTPEPVIEEATEEVLAEVVPEPTPEPAPAVAPLPRPAFGMPSAPESGSAPVRTAPEYLTARDGVQGVRAGEHFESWRQLAAAALTVGRSIDPGSSIKHELAVIRADYPEERRLSDDIVFNLDKFEPDELTAALCAPATPYYNLACANTLRRPVFNSLPQFAAPRGKVSIYPSPSLADITTGYGQWTAVNDANANATKSACQTIACASPTEYVMYGVYRCLTVKNMLAMTYPELVEAYLNRLGAAHARLAEQLLLNAMGTASTAVTAPALGYGGTVTVTSTILNLIALWQEQERWDLGPMHVWLPRWVLYAMKMDVMRRRNTDSNWRVPSDAEINAKFGEVGVSQVTWFIDTPSWATPVPAVRFGTTLNLMPRLVEMIIAPASKFAVIDRGELAIGVTGNNIYRDNTSNSKNEFTFFFENFEGVVDTESCPAYKLTVPACWNGIQIADAAIDCEGNDYAGVGS